MGVALVSGLGSTEKENRLQTGGQGGQKFGRNIEEVTDLFEFHH